LHKALNRYEGGVGNDARCLRGFRKAPPLKDPGGVNGLGVTTGKGKQSQLSPQRETPEHNAVAPFRGNKENTKEKEIG